MKSVHLGDESTTMATDLKTAIGFLARSKGLLGRRSLTPGEALWIKRCNSIHTFFMRFPIDAVFVDSSLKVIHVYRALPPWRITRPHLRASSVMEFSAGTISKDLKPGDQLYVES